MPRQDGGRGGRRRGHVGTQGGDADHGVPVAEPEPVAVQRHGSGEGGRREQACAHSERVYVTRTACYHPVMLDKVVATAAEAVADVPDGASLAVGGFGMTGVPAVLITALLDQGAERLEIISNNLGIDGYGLGVLLAAGRIRRTIGSYVGNNKEFARQYLAGELEFEITPQGTLAERLRAGGAGIPAFFTPAGVGTLVAEGGLPWRYAADGSVAVASPPKEVREFDGVTYLLERAIRPDYALVHAWQGDRHGNLVFRKSSRNFNPAAAAAGRVTIAQVEHLVEPGEIDPDAVHTPGIHVQRVVHVPGVEKPVEIRTVRS
jgi:3-oxoacid CoA-transferase subunit A